jgi:hypothetical protein
MSTHTSSWGRRRLSSYSRSFLPFLAGGAGLIAAGFAAYVVAAWGRYGRHAPRPPDPLLDRFMPACEVGERHQTRVAAPAGVTMETARALDFRRLPVAQVLFRIRAWLLGDDGAKPEPPHGLEEETRAMGWGVLADEPNALVMGAVCRPWEADPGFRPVPPEAFAAFAEPSLVKIVWAIGVEPDGPAASVAWTETRVATTDAAARARFRRYWAALSPGILLIRREALRLVRADAERRARAIPPTPQAV